MHEMLKAGSLVLYDFYCKAFIVRSQKAWSL